jgi:hypothetical protein
VVSISNEWLLMITVTSKIPRLGDHRKNRENVDGHIEALNPKFPVFLAV